MAPRAGGNFNDFSGHLLSPVFKVLVKWPYGRASLVGLSRQDRMLTNLCIVLKIEEYPCSEAISGWCVLCCSVYCT